MNNIVLFSLFFYIKNTIVYKNFLGKYDKISYSGRRDIWNF